MQQQPPPYMPPQQQQQYPPGYVQQPMYQQPMHMMPQQQQQQQQSVVVVNNSAPAPVPAQTVVVERPRVNHFLHLIITILFFPWVIVWFILCITEGGFGITPA
ncbi:alpha/beta-gliadin clone PW1215-like [Haliotis rufescens]|uniref:alpha/beta-gliadin clone PW1215-like n=1 Tax=Haliotis rufescens TaxID=6454 RepID=UPI001EAFA308|nr:alpha/beta-gliadin clone PW1215-like [Haliotis rufescens]